MTSVCPQAASASTNCLVASARFMRHSDKSLGWLIIDKQRRSNATNHSYENGSGSATTLIDWVDNALGEIVRKGSERVWEEAA